MFDYRRSHTCGALTKADSGSEVTLSGWVHRRRDLGKLIFIDLRDRYGITQLLFDPEKAPSAHAAAARLRSEWVISVKGIVRPRAEGQENENMDTGAIEVEALEFDILSEALTPPFSIYDDGTETSEDLRLKYRYLDLRREKQSSYLQTRHKMMLHTRTYLDSESFCEVSTPILGRSTPEGARDYLVPSRLYPGNFFALPQSPQIFKQLLMIGGLDRYFQIAPCFRDEDLRADRQPEFHQIDVEMSFGTPEDIIGLTEGLMKELFSKVLKVKVDAPFYRMTHLEAMELYGTDRPDRRFGMMLTRVDDIAARSEFGVFKKVLDEGGAIKAICVPGGASLSRREIERYTDFVKPFGLHGLAFMKCEEAGLASNIVKFFKEAELKELQSRLEAKEGDLLLFAAADEKIVNQSLDHLRRKLAHDRSLIDKDAFAFVWVVDFPLFCWDEDEERLSSEHHPFTAPHPDDIHLLDTDPLKVRSLAYDIVLNGFEVGGGSQRIHDSEVQEKIFRLLKLSPDEIKEKFGFFVDALKFGTPPHLGIALGFDRLVMLFTGSENIREVIAFPKSLKASDFMMRCPSPVREEQLKELDIQILESKEIPWV